MSSEVLDTRSELEKLVGTYERPPFPTGLIFGLAALVSGAVLVMLLVGRKK